jgi:hypothetical protein
MNMFVMIWFWMHVLKRQKGLFVKRFKNLPVIKFTSKPYTNGDKILSVV